MKSVSCKVKDVQYGIISLKCFRQIHSFSSLQLQHFVKLNLL